MLQWFDKRRTLAYGISAMGISLGALLWPPCIVALTEAYSWRGALLLSAGIHLQALVVMSLYRSVPVYSVELDGEDLSEVVIPNSKVLPEAGPQPSPVTIIMRLCKQPAFIVFNLCMILNYMSHIIPYTYLPARGRLSGFSETYSALLMSAVGGTMALCRPLVGLLGDKLGHKRLVVSAVTIILTGALSASSIFCRLYWQLLMYSIIWAIVSSKTFLLLKGQRYLTFQMIRVFIGA